MGFKILIRFVMPSTQKMVSVSIFRSAVFTMVGKVPGMTVLFLNFKPVDNFIRIEGLVPVRDQSSILAAAGKNH